MTYNDVFFVASILEDVARQTDNRIGDIARQIGCEKIRFMLQDAEVAHCLSTEQNVAETVERYHIQNGNYRPFAFSKDFSPRSRQIGKVYARLVEDDEPNPEKYPEKLYEILTSPFSERIANYNAATYYAPSNELHYLYTCSKTAQ